MVSIEIIVCHYNSKAFESLFQYCEGIKVTVYDKSQVYVPPNDEINVIKIPNIGRESEVYLDHIIKNYDTLADYTIFIQDDSDNHLEYMGYPELFKRIQNVVVENKDFYHFPCSWRKTDGRSRSRIITKGKQPVHTVPLGSIEKCCEIIGKEMPNQFKTELCAHFIVSKETIRRFEKDIYNNLFNWLSTDSRGFGHTFEHSWNLIFNKDL
jgi:hypothetical protein